MENKLEIIYFWYKNSRVWINLWYVYIISGYWYIEERSKKKQQDMSRK